MSSPKRRREDVDRRLSMANNDHNLLSVRRQPTISKELYDGNLNEDPMSEMMDKGGLVSAGMRSSMFNRDVTYLRRDVVGIMKRG